MQILFIIPARGGSRGIPGKNVRPLAGKPLVHYSLEYARLFAEDNDICLTTDSEEITAVAAKLGYRTRFLRPAELATDTAGTYEVLQHALAEYEKTGPRYDAVVLLQPTSPFREAYHLREALALYTPDLDMVVSVSESKANPYFNLFEENEDGFLAVSKGHGTYTRRQDAPPVYAYNGSLYVIHTQALREKAGFRAFRRVRKYVMDAAYSVDLDTEADWRYAEFVFSHEGTKAPKSQI